MTKKSALWLAFTNFTLVIVVFTLVTGVTSCKKDELTETPESLSTAVSVLTLKNGNVNNLEVGMWGIFDGSQSYGYDSTKQFIWQMGDGTPMINTDNNKLVYRYETPGFYTVTLMVFDSNANGSVAEISLEVVPRGTLKSQVLLRNASQPDSTGRIEYTIALALDSCSTSTGIYKYMIFGDNGYSSYDFLEQETINGSPYGIFKITDYNRILNFIYLSDNGNANISNSVYYNGEMELLQATLMDGEMMPLNQLDESLPGEFGDDVLRIYKTGECLKIFVNFKDYTNNPRSPWLGYSPDNKMFQNQRMFWMGGTGWAELNISPSDVMYFRFGGDYENLDEIGEINTSMFYIGEFDAIVVKFIPIKK